MSGQIDAELEIAEPAGLDRPCVPVHTDATKSIDVVGGIMAASGADATRVRVTVQSGMVEGIREAGIDRFLGIPFAAAPFGVNRLRAPQPVVQWEGVRQAVEYGPTAPKQPYSPGFRELLPEIDIEGEECLNLNVWSPDLTASLPVLVFIHGGSFLAGSGSVEVYEGSAFARDGIVCVTINYRLGAEGFLHVGDSEANLGLLDQLAALVWVQENIAAFGGDPNRVTISGESAGGMSVTTLLSMKQSEGLFAQAIAQSGGALHTLTDDLGRLVSQRLAERFGIENTREAFRLVDVNELSVAATELANQDVRSTPPDPDRWGHLTLTMTPFAPSVDGEVLLEHPLDAMASGAGSSIPLLTGWNRDEGRFFLVGSGAIDLVDNEALEIAANGYGMSEEFLQLYRSNHPGASAGDLLAGLFGDWMFAMPAIKVAETRAPSANTWVYRFDHPQDLSNRGLGAAHTGELAYMFDTIHLKGTHAVIGDTPSREVVDTIHGTWVKFIRDGNPGWRAYQPDERWVGVLTTEVAETLDPSGDERRALTGGIAMSSSQL